MRNRTLSSHEETRNILQQLRAEGVKVNIPDEWDAPELCPLRVARGRFPGTVCEVEGSTCYALPICIVAKARVIVCDFALRSEWDEETMELPHLREKRGRYQFGHLDYAVDEVINDRLEKGFRLNFRGDMLQGVIIAYGLDPLPVKYGTNAMVPVYVTFIDSLDRCSVETRIDLMVGERSRNACTESLHSCPQELCAPIENIHSAVRQPQSSS